jgi:hypothetical protein
MSAGRTRRKGGALGRVASAMTSFAGIATALATIMTSVTAVLGLMVHHQATQLKQAQAVASLQARQIQNLKTSQSAAPATPTASATPGGADSSGTVPVTGVSHYLSDLTPTVDNASPATEQQVIAARPYTKSVSFYCDGGSGSQPDVAYDVAGSSTFTAEVGIPDNMQNATDVIATVTFSNESGQRLGKPIQVSLGHPVKLELPIGNVTQLGMTCNGRDARTGQLANSFQVSLGDAGVS